MRKIAVSDFIKHTVQILDFINKKAGIYLTMRKESQEPVAVVMSMRRYRSLMAYVNMRPEEIKEYLTYCKDFESENGPKEKYVELPELEEDACV